MPAKPKRTRPQRPPKSTRRKQVKTKAVTCEERNNMFMFWFDNDRNISATADQFTGRSRSLIYKIKEEDDWDGRAKIIDQKVKAGIDRKMVAKQLSNVDMVQACLNREVKACLEKKPSKVAGSPQNIVLMAHYIDEARGALPQAPSTPAMSPAMQAALQMLEDMNTQDLKTLADLIAKTRKPVEGDEQ